MKYVIIIPDGCADFPVESLDNRTPLQAARTPALDALAKNGLVGLTDNVPRHLPAGSEVANMTLFGCDPNRYFTGRAPIEAAAQGIALGPEDWAIRCNIVTVANQIMEDFTADHISTEDSTSLLASMQERVLDYPQLTFVPGVSYRNLLIYRGDAERKAPFSADTRTRAPHDLTDLPVADEYPRGPGSDLLCELMQRSEQCFEQHEVNDRRRAAGRRLATNIWLWGLGKSPQLPSFESRFGLKGAMITAVDLLRGLAALIGWENIRVPGATGYLDTDYAGKGRAAIEALQNVDIVCVHVEATDEASHEGRVDAKIEALEAIDSQIVAPVVEALQKWGEYRILVLPDHPTPVSTKKHSHGFVPFVVSGRGISAGAAQTYDEVAAELSRVSFPDGWKLMETFIHGSFH
jgi:2,3-bisphosphoglycerate-independent phosphoglycerate mutase